MSALAIPVPAPAHHPRRRGHLQLVGPGYVAVPAHPLDASPGAGESRAGERPQAQQPSRQPAIRLTARGRTVRAALGLLLGTLLSIGAGSVLGGLVGPGGAADSGPVERVSVTVGDNLWGIAAATAAPGQDVRDLVDDILRLNGLTSAELAVGQQLLVPAG